MAIESADQSSSGRDQPPGSWAPARRLVRRALAPVERFLEIEAASGILLLIAAAMALVWANSPWHESYAALWHTPVGVRLGAFSFDRALRFWINEGLMTIFFFVVGLEIRREIHRGELSEPRRAALPVAAALGGMVVPAAIYLALNYGRHSIRGWGTPMATDIAFAVGVLALMGRRVPPALRVLLLTLAVIDDLGAIVVIAVFYGSELSVLGFSIFGAGFLGIIALQMFGVRRTSAFVFPAMVMWAGAYRAGVHPTLAGVVAGLLTPATAWFGVGRFVEQADASVDAVLRSEANDEHSVVPHLSNLDHARREAVSPLDRVEHALHGWVAFGIMPLFAFANAGIPIGDLSLSGDSMRVFLGVALGLLLGKPVGIFAVSWICVRMGVAALPRGVTWAGIGILGLVGGVGFTMALFIAQLAFANDPLLEGAKLGILGASFAAAVGGLVSGAAMLPKQPAPGAALTAQEAESSAEA